MLSFRLIVVAVLGFLLGFCGQKVFAGDNGVLKLEVPDAAAVGMGGAATGEADRPSAVYYNPAGMVQMNTFEASVGLTLLQPQITFESLTANNGNTSQMKRDNYIFPDFFATTPLIKNRLYLGLGESSDFGSGNDWAADSFSRYDTVKDSVENKDFRLVAAYKINDQWSVGVGVKDDQSKAEHDAALFQGGGASPDGDALLKASDYAFGFDLGAMFKLNAQNQFGLSYKSPIHHTYDGTLYVNNLNHGYKDYQAIFGGTSFQTRAIQKLPLPQSVTLGYSLKPTHKWTFNFDLEWTDWSNYKKQTTFYPDVTSAAQLAVLGTGNPQAREWHSVWSESLGVQYAMNDKFRIRAGYSHHQTPVPEVTFDTAFPDSDSNAYSFGIGYDLTRSLTIDIAYVADFYQSRNVVNTVDSALGASLSGKYREFANLGKLSLTYKF